MERPKRNSQKLPDPDYICTLADMYKYIRMVSPTKSSSKKCRTVIGEKTTAQDQQEAESPCKKSGATSSSVERTKDGNPSKSAKTPKSPKVGLSEENLKPPSGMASHNLVSKGKNTRVISSRIRRNKPKGQRETDASNTNTSHQKAVSEKKEKIPDRSKFTKLKTRHLPLRQSVKSAKSTKLGRRESERRERLEFDPSAKQPCTRTNCPAKAPICFARVSKCCAGNSFTGRWYHLSFGEHFCQMCFEWAYRKEGSKAYAGWKRTWEANGQTDGSPRLFYADQYLPFWVKCTKPTCGKWRQLSRDTNVTSDLIRTFVCGSTNKKPVKDPCSNPEDLRAQAVYDENWARGISHAPYLKDSPAAPFLKRYHSDAVGLSPFYNQMFRLNEKHQKKEEKDQSDKSSTSSESDAEHLENGTEVPCAKANDACRTNGVHVHTDALSNGQSEGSVHSSDSHTNSVNGLPHAPSIFKSGGGLAFLQPFYQPGSPAKALDFNPDFMDAEEIQLFSQFSKCQHSYLALRNIVIALWNLNPKEWLTAETCASHVIQRGLVRIRSVAQIERILSYLTLKGYVNYGLVNKPEHLSFSPVNKEHVIVIGAGASGLSAAHHLNRMGVKVTVLEARDRIGGRIRDDHLGDTCVGQGAQIVVGSVNNPLMVLAHQAGLSVREINDQCDLYEESGHVTDRSVDGRIDYHFNAMLDRVAEWRQKAGAKKDVHLLAKIRNTHKRFVEESQLPFSEQEERLLQFHISNLEYACGCDLTHVSAQNWDQNEAYPQFTGKHMMMTSGYGRLLAKMAEGLDIRLNAEVSQVGYDDSQVTVMLSSGETLNATRVIVTLPLALLQRRAVFFEPTLPQKKIRAIDGLGAGIIEKVALRFPYRFWGQRTGDADCIGHVPSSEDTRGLFAVFYDMSPDKSSGPGILKSFVSGNGVRVIKQRSDAEVVQMCVAMLARMFPEQPIPEVESSFVTHWLEDPHARMSYSYVPVGCSGALYETLAEPVKNKLYFAGEATNRQFPQSVTGAYLSGLREAYRILVDVIPDLQPKPPEIIQAKKQKSKGKSAGKRPKVPPKKQARIDATTNGTAAHMTAGVKRQGMITESEGVSAKKARLTPPKSRAGGKNIQKRKTPTRSSSRVCTPIFTEIKEKVNKTPLGRTRSRSRASVEETELPSVSPSEKRKKSHPMKTFTEVSFERESQDQGQSDDNDEGSPAKRGRGRPRKNPKPESIVEDVFIKQEIFDDVMAPASQEPEMLSLSEIKQEMEDCLQNEADCNGDADLNGSFRVVGSLEFDVTSPGHDATEQQGNDCRSFISGKEALSKPKSEQQLRTEAQNGDDTLCCSAETKIDEDAKRQDSKQTGASFAPEVQFDIEKNRSEHDNKSNQPDSASISKPHSSSTNEPYTDTGDTVQLRSGAQFDFKPEGDTSDTTENAYASLNEFQNSTPTDSQTGSQCASLCGSSQDQPLTKSQITGDSVGDTGNDSKREDEVRHETSQNNLPRGDSENVHSIQDKPAAPPTTVMDSVDLPLCDESHQLKSDHEDQPGKSPQSEGIESSEESHNGAKLMKDTAETNSDQIERIHDTDPPSGLVNELFEENEDLDVNKENMMGNHKEMQSDGKKLRNVEAESEYGLKGEGD